MFKILSSKFKALISSFWQVLSFALLLMLYLAGKTVAKIGGARYFPKAVKKKLQGPLNAFYQKLAKLLGGEKTGSISRVDLIELSFKNMQAKKTRTAVTIGGMMIGIGAIVFLVSIGYGLQEMVIGRVARLEEMRQADVSPQAGGKVKITDKTLADFKQVPAVESALPLIAVVGRVNYQNSVSDMAVYGVTSDYLRQSAIKPVQGEIFDSNELVSSIKQPTPGLEEVAGASTSKGEFGEEIGKVDFTINPSSWIRVREEPTTRAKILGYTKRTEGISSGVEVWGGEYEADNGAGRAGETEDGQPLGKWIKASVLLWEEKECDPQTEGDCEEGGYLVMRGEDGQQAKKEGYFAEINLQVSDTKYQASGMEEQKDIDENILGEATPEADVEAEATTDAGIGDEAAIDWVEIATESGIIAPLETKTVALTEEAKRQAVVNRAMLKVLGINENEAVGKKFEVSFVVVGELLEEEKEKVESAPVEYTIVGVTPEEKTPLFYVPFIDLRSLGITNYSQVKLIVKDQVELAKARRQVEAMGYVTRSVVDTVEQINSLFSTLRTALLLLGMVALAVAALGMFNTLTVSLLERTREVGLMKALGMKSAEVKELFLTESMVMGLFGGVLGIILGAVLGKLLGLVLSLAAFSQEAGFIDVSYIPFPFVLTIVLLSLLVGITTGIYPARRATKISALNALRYE